MIASSAVHAMDYSEQTAVLKALDAWSGRSAIDDRVTLMRAQYMVRKTISYLDMFNPKHGDYSLIFAVKKLLDEACIVGCGDPLYNAPVDEQEIQRDEKLFWVHTCQIIKALNGLMSLKSNSTL